MNYKKAFELKKQFEKQFDRQFFEIIPSGHSINDEIQYIVIESYINFPEYSETFNIKELAKCN